VTYRNKVALHCIAEYYCMLVGWFAYQNLYTVSQKSKPLDV